MSGVWKPKQRVVCDKCGWTGLRAVIGKKCPACGHWHPKAEHVTTQPKGEAR